MNLGLLIRTLRETRGSCLAFAAGLFAFELFLALILPTFQKEFADSLMQIEFLQKIIAALLGAEVGSFTPKLALAMLGWVHPFVLALVWAHAIMTCTRFPAGELERGTLDALMSLPVSRVAVLGHDTLAFMLTAGAVVVAGLAGDLIGARISGLGTAPLAAVLQVTCNLYAMALAVGGVATGLSCLSERRGRAMGAAFGIVLASFFLSSMSAFNETVKQWSAVSLMNYYRPYYVLEGSRSPWGDMLVLLVVGAGCWALGLVVLGRRDLRTV